MSVEFVPAYFRDPQSRCVIGNHAVDDQSDLMYRADGSWLCIVHVLEITEAYELTKAKEGVSRHNMIREWNRRETARNKETRLKEMGTSSFLSPGFIYYLRIGQHIKIGYTADVNKRMRAYPPSAELLAIHPGTKQTEKDIHAQFGEHLDRGREWFSQGQSLTTHVTAAREQFGDPAVFAHSYGHAKSATRR